MNNGELLKVDNVGSNKSSEPPNINIKKLGIVSHDYSCEEDNKLRDFSYAFADILKCLDNKGCNSVLFALFTLIPRNDFKIEDYLKEQKNIELVFIEEFKEENGNKYVIYYKLDSNWHKYCLTQKFGKLKYTHKFRNEIITPFINEVRTQRIFGNFTVLLCGESNIVKYSKKSKSVEDPFNYLKEIPINIKVILNPIHDRMTRFEMKRKREFLSNKERYVVSVWNKGKKDKNGKVKDGKKPAWTVFYNGKEITLEKIDDCPIASKSNIEIGVCELPCNSVPV
jgi:hypothetical protein